MLEQCIINEYSITEMKYQPAIIRPEQSNSMLRMLLIKSLFFIFSALPLRLNHLLGALIGRMYILFPNRQNRVSRINLQLCFPDDDALKRQQLHHQSLIETSKTLTESGPMWHWSKDKLLSLVRKTSGEEAFIRAIKSDRGVILAMPHLGNWELVNLYCSIHQPITTLYRPPNLPQLDDYILKSRQRFGAELVPTNARGIRKLYRALNQGRLIGILPDQDPGIENGEFANFFGIQAYTMTLLSRLAHKYQTRVFFAYAQRLDRGSGYHIHFSEADQSIRDEMLQSSVQSLNNAVEMCVRERPEQYQWGYKRFKTRQKKQARFY